MLTVRGLVKATKQTSPYLGRFTALFRRYIRFSFVLRQSPSGIFDYYFVLSSDGQPQSLRTSDAVGVIFLTSSKSLFYLTRFRSCRNKLFGSIHFCHSLLCHLQAEHLNDFQAVRIFVHVICMRRSAPPTGISFPQPRSHSGCIINISMSTQIIYL